MSKKSSRHYVSASEIGRVAYCPNALALEHQGKKASRSAEVNRARGNRGHQLYNQENIRKDKSPCFIATQTLGTDHIITQQLRIYRDEKLTKHFIGRAFIAIYYRMSPFLIPLLQKYTWADRYAKRMVIAFYQLFVRD